MFSAHECLKTNLGQYYMGELATTVTGKRCKRWDAANFTEGMTMKNVQK